MSEQIFDAHARLQALDPQRSFLVQAPAGSGKTELLTDRILALLATVDRPEEIVAITFTRKAASEMHARVLLKLAQGLGPEPAQAHRRQSWALARAAIERDRQQGWHLLQYPSRLSIRTIDAFCAYLVRGMPWLSTMGGMPGVCDDARQYYRAAAQATLAMADDMPAVAQVVAHLDVDLRAAETLLADMLGSRDQWMPLLEAGSDASLLADHLASAVDEDLERLAGLMPVGWAQSLAEPCRMAVANLTQTGQGGDVAPLLDWDGQPFDPAHVNLAQWQALASMVLKKDGDIRKTVDKRQGFEAKTAYKEAFVAWLKGFDGSEPWIQAMAEICHAPQEGYQDWQLEVLEQLIQVLRLTWAQLMMQFAQAGEVDFIEIAQRALRALGSADEPTDLLLSLDASIRHLLVDEFQDTSHTQIELLARLTSGWSPDDGRTLFLVGDPMQSIYRFRKAEVGLFLKVQEQGLSELPLTALQLTTNFRSQTAVVDWVNHVFKPLFPHTPHVGLGAIPYTASQAFNPPLDGLGVQLCPVWSRVDDDGDPEASAREAEALTVKLAREALARNPDSEHPVAILVRARTHLQDVVRLLAQEGVPCRAVELVSLRSRQVISDLVQLACALSHPDDRLAWLSILRSPMCGLRLHTLHGLFGVRPERTVPDVLQAYLHEADPQAWGLDNEEHSRVTHAATVLLDPYNDDGVMPFASWLELCWTRLGGKLVYGSDNDLADTQSFFRLVEKLAPYGGLDPAELASALDNLYAAPGSQGGPAVEVMTIHKSKGLQFDTVILMGLHRRPRGETQRLLHFEFSEGRLLLGPIRPKASDQSDPVTHYLQQREKRRSAYETDRLLYVAVTRAREQLYLVAQLNLDDKGQVKAPSAGSLMAHLLPYIRLPEPPPPDVHGRADSDDGAGVPSADIMLPGAASVPKSQRALWRLPLSALHQMSRPSVAADQSRAVNTAWDWSQAFNEESLIGTVAHAWLERLGKAGGAGWRAAQIPDQADVIRRQLSRAGIALERLDMATQAVCETLEATLSSERGRWLLGVAKAYREWSLLDVSGRVSVIDLAISEAQGWLVVDYKTGRPHEGETAENFATRMRERYADQMARYRAQVSALDGRPARSALYFPRADIWIEE